MHGKREMRYKRAVRTLDIRQGIITVRKYIESEADVSGVFHKILKHDVIETHRKAMGEQEHQALHAQQQHAQIVRL
jgi:hypothetical protein